MMRVPISCSLLVAVVAVMVDVSAAAAEEPAAFAGQRVRLTVPSVSGKRLIGTLVGLDETTLTLRRYGVDDTLQVPREAIARLEVSRHRSRKAKGAALGALIGLGAALAVGVAAGDDCGLIQGDDFSTRLQRSFCFDKGETAVISAILFVPAGTLLGLVAAPGEKWEPSTPGRLRVGVAPMRGGGVRVGLSVAF